MALTDQLETMSRRHAEVSAELSRPGILNNPGLMTRLSKEIAELGPVVEAYRGYRQMQREEEEANQLLVDAADDPEMRQMARDEIERLRERLVEAEQAMQWLLIPKDPDDAKNAILEIRAGTGGEEAALFAADLSRMYLRFAELRGWRVEVLSESPTALGGYKEIIAMVSGNGAFSVLKFESGVHRVQRVPDTEAGGRIHTSACTVAVLPEADEVDVQVDDKELRIDVYRSSGPGGQSVNTTDSAVRITHLPTGMIVICQDEKSQHKNKAKAMKVLMARLLDRERQSAHEVRAMDRRSQVGSGDRSERIRTYNFPQSRVTDHRVNLTLHKLEQVLQGDLEEIVSALIADDRAKLLASLGT